MSFCELENLFERRDALTGKGVAEPGAGVQAAQLGEAEIMYGALAIGGTIHRVIVNRDETSVAREL